jgi:hypothetical protein
MKEKGLKTLSPRVSFSGHDASLSGYGTPAKVGIINNQSAQAN